ncbi:hypothetical protein [Archangium primigenium]|uniref:hypothetical protein n=1 Tax=[Archangium] primigenium TaxID=2792470 RepID=UPI00195C64C8|nr:hypothetical protein [Archangium primigenium]MBM7117639.1 hypothetical protein [Archangium primigenium]
MSNVDEIKQRLQQRTWPEYKRVSVEAEGGPVELVIRRPPDRVLERLLTQAREAGLNLAKGEADNPVAAVRFRAELVAATVFLPNAVTSLFTPEEVLDWPGCADVSEHCMAALAPSKGLEQAKGN